MGQIGGLQLAGLPAWLLVHIFFLVGFRDRFVVLFTWAWARLTWQRSARLIVERQARDCLQARSTAGTWPGNASSRGRSSASHQAISATSFGSRTSSAAPSSTAWK